MSLPSVLVLGGGPDDERDVSLASAASVARALREAGVDVHDVTIDRPDADEIRSMPGEVVFPVLHGSFGEGGRLQQLLDSDGRPYVGSGAHASRLAMDKMATKLLAAGLGIATPDACVCNVNDPAPPLDPPLVIKPVHDGSSVGLHLCHDEAEWVEARRLVRMDVAARPGRAYMVEQMVEGRELTVGLLERGRGLEALPLIEIVPAAGVYDYEAKYDRDDTTYLVEPDLPEGVASSCGAAALALANAIGVRHLGRVDFLLGPGGEPMLLELNTMPGFTSHSLLPMAARCAGLEMPQLCTTAVEAASARIAGV